MSGKKTAELLSGKKYYLHCYRLRIFCQ